MLRTTTIANELAAIERKLKETDNVTLKEALKKKQARLKEELKDPSKSASQLAKILLSQRQAVKALSKVEFNDLIRRLSKKPEYSFLKSMPKGVIKNDLQVTAKPVGWRFKGRGNYDKPTKAEIAKGKKSGTVYREVRPRRSDVSQVVKLANGGGIENCTLAYTMFHDFVELSNAEYNQDSNVIPYLEMNGVIVNYTQGNKNIAVIVYNPRMEKLPMLSVISNVMSMFPQNVQANITSFTSKYKKDSQKLCEASLIKIVNHNGELIEEFEGLKNGGNVDSSDIEYSLRMVIDNQGLNPVALKSVKKSGKNFVVTVSSYITPSNLVSGLNSLLKTSFEIIDGSLSKSVTGNKIFKMKETKMKEGGNISEKYCVVMSGGSIGSKGMFDKKGRKLVEIFETREEAAAYAKRRNSQLSPGEKSYYKMKYYISPYNEKDFISKMAKGGLVGNQHKLDVNKNGRIDSEDLAMLRNNKMAKGGYLEGREEYEGYNYQIWYNPRKDMYSVSDNIGVFKGDNNYFDMYDQAKEHAEISIRSMLESEEEMAKGGILEKESLEMINNQAKSASHHINELQGVLKSNPNIEPWVVAKMQRATTDLADITHYLDGKDQKMHYGGGVEADYVVFSVNDDSLDTLLNDFHSRELDYVDINGDSYYKLNKRDFDRFIDAADSKGFDVDYENSEDSVIYVQENMMAKGGSMYANGGKIGSHIVFRDMRDEVREGDIIDVLPNGGYEVRVGFGTALVLPNEVISFKDKMAYGGSTNDDEANKITVRKDKTNPNFLFVEISYYSGRGFLVGMTAQLREEGSKRAMKIALDIENKMKQSFNIEDSEAVDLNNGLIQLFLVSNDFINIDPKKDSKLNKIIFEKYANGGSMYADGGSVKVIDKMPEGYKKISYDEIKDLKIGQKVSFAYYVYSTNIHLVKGEIVRINNNSDNKYKWTIRIDDGKGGYSYNVKDIYTKTGKMSDGGSMYADGGTIEIGDKVKATKEYGGKSGTVIEKRGSFVIVEDSKGRTESYHESDLTKKAAKGGLVGKQHKLDVNKNGRIDADDLARLRGEKMAKGGSTKKQREKVGKVMHEFKAGKLHSGSKKGPIVKDRDQAIAIALSEAGMSKKMAKGGLTGDQYKLDVNKNGKIDSEDLAKLRGEMAKGGSASGNRLEMAAKEFFTDGGIGEKYVKNGKFDSKTFKSDMINRTSKKGRTESLIKLWGRGLEMNVSKYIDGDILENIEFSEDSTKRAKELFDSLNTKMAKGGSAGWKHKMK